MIDYSAVTVMLYICIYARTSTYILYVYILVHICNSPVDVLRDMSSEAKATIMTRGIYAMPEIELYFLEVR
jgi:hypothetical protein